MGLRCAKAHGALTHSLPAYPNSIGADNACNFEKIWVREASLPVCLSASADATAQRDAAAGEGAYFGDGGGDAAWLGARGCGKS